MNTQYIFSSDSESTLWVSKHQLGFHVLFDLLVPVIWETHNRITDDLLFVPPACRINSYTYLCWCPCNWQCRIVSSIVQHIYLHHIISFCAWVNSFIEKLSMLVCWNCFPSVSFQSISRLPSERIRREFQVWTQGLKGSIFPKSSAFMLLQNCSEPVLSRDHDILSSVSIYLTCFMNPQAAWLSESIEIVYICEW